MAAWKFKRPDPDENSEDGGIQAERARGLIRQICAAREVVIVRGAVSPDHIHLLLAAPRKQYWGQHMWARGYFCATGAVDEATIKAKMTNRSRITVPAKP